MNNNLYTTLFILLIQFFPLTALDKIPKTEEDSKRESALINTLRETSARKKELDAPLTIARKILFEKRSGYIGPGLPKHLGRHVCRYVDLDHRYSLPICDKLATIHSVAIAPNKKFALALFSESPNSKTLKLWDLSKKNETLTETCKNIKNIAISPDSTMIAMILYDQDTARSHVELGSIALDRATSLTCDKEVSVCKFASDSTRLASAEKDGIIQLWDIKTSKQVTMLNSSTSHSIDTIDISKDGNTIISNGFYRDIVNVFDVRSGKLIHQFQHYSTKIIFLTENEFIASSFSFHGEHPGIKKWKIGNRQPVETINTKRTQCMAISQDGTRLVAGGTDRWEDNTNNIEVLNLQTKHSKKLKAGTMACLDYVDVSADGQTIVSAFNPDTQVVVWQTDAYTNLKALYKEDVSKTDDDEDDKIISL